MKLLTKMFDREQVGFDRWQAVVFCIIITGNFVPIVVGMFAHVSYLALLLTSDFCVYLFAMDVLYLASSVIYTRGNWGQYLCYLVASFLVFALLLCMVPVLL